MAQPEPTSREPQFRITYGDIKFELADGFVGNYGGQDGLVQALKGVRKSKGVMGILTSGNVLVLFDGGREAEIEIEIPATNPSSVQGGPVEEGGPIKI